MSLPPIRRQVVVPAGAAAAFDVFTADIGRWWPVGAGFSVYGDWSPGPTVAFRDGRVVESGPAGAEAVWGSVLDWDRPRRVRLTWHPGADPGKASEVEVTFVPVTEDRTLVTVEHRGWERFPDPAAARQEYHRGWPEVLARYAAGVPATADLAGGTVAPDPAAGPVWLALLHTPGPAATGPGGVFGNPDFPEHPAFLRRLQERGVLVAAGPFPASGEGMTVLRVDDPAQVGEYVRLAQEEDLAVARGVLMVRVRPWQVMFTGQT